jgi:UDPglucose--hexose-1-phosphate uridylyltransferase
MPELRIDPIVGRRVYVAEDRAGRPNDYEACASAAERPGSHSPCCFCAGREVETPDARATVLDAEGRWIIRVVPNKFPAVVLEGPADGAFGAHEVIIESPRHLLEITELGIEGLASVLGMYRDRLRHWASDSRLKHAVLFKNSGFAAGASLEHVHSQLVALPYVPAAVQAELDAVARFRAAHGRCLFCDLMQREGETHERLVMRQDGYLVCSAYAPRQPFETWLLPERHAPRFETLDDADLPACSTSCCAGYKRPRQGLRTTCCCIPGPSRRRTKLSTGTGSLSPGSRATRASSGAAPCTSRRFRRSAPRRNCGRRFECRVAIVRDQAWSHLHYCDESAQPAICRRQAAKFL